MKRSEIRVGAEYVYRAGRYGTHYRCAVLDKGDWANVHTEWILRYSGSMALTAAYAIRPGRKFRDEQPRIAVVVEIERDGAPPLLVPHAARCAEIVGTWADELERRAAAERQAEVGRRAYEIAQRQAQERGAAARAEHEREAAERRKREAIARERYETRIEPALRELGLDPRPETLASGGRVVLSFDDAERLAALLDMLCRVADDT